MNIDTLTSALFTAKGGMEYITGKGISGDRLVSKGFGESQPIESNKTRKGKAKNRRIEFRLVQ